jgi:hypothetical protein
MNRDHQRDTVILFGQNPAKVAVPRVAMHEIGTDVHGVEIRASPHRAEGRTQRLWARKISRVEFEADDLEIAFVDMLIAEATYFYGHSLGQFT